MKFFFKHSYYKARIIISFTLVTVMLVTVMALVSYYFVKDIYLGQLKENISQSSQLIGNKFENKYLSLLQLGKPVKSVDNYFKGVIKENLNPEFYSGLFLFDKNFKVLFHSDSSAKISSANNLLQLNRKEIVSLDEGKSISSVPFKADNNRWYLWGYYKLNSDYYFAIKASAEKLDMISYLANLFFIIGFAGAALTAMLGWFIARSITKPLNNLIDYSVQIGEGNFGLDKPDGMFGEIKKLSDALFKMKNDLSKNQKEKENILAQIAHEIRNPLGGMELLVNLVKEDLVNDPASKEYLDKILNEIYRLKTLITSFLNYSRPVPTEAEWVSVKNVIGELNDVFNLRANKKNINFDVKIAHDKIWFDKSQFRQIMLNIISNSVESITEAGRIGIYSKIKNGNWIIEITDNGCGIPEDNQGQIFEPFFTTKKTGTGLGLPISKKLCYSNKANLIVNSSLNGSTFSIIKKVINEN